jgi:hypothetical protein
LPAEALEAGVPGLALAPDFAVPAGFRFIVLL